MNKRKIGELLLILGTVLFVGCAVFSITRQLPAEQIPRIGALAHLYGRRCGPEEVEIIKREE